MTCRVSSGFSSPKLERIEATGVDTHPPRDRLVCKKVRDTQSSHSGDNMGCPIRQLLGGENLSPLVRFLRIVLSSRVIGQRTCATCLRLVPADTTGAGRVGVYFDAER